MLTTTFSHGPFGKSVWCNGASQGIAVLSTVRQSSQVRTNFWTWLGSCCLLWTMRWCTSCTAYSSCHLSFLGVAMCSPRNTIPSTTERPCYTFQNSCNSKLARDLLDGQPSLMKLSNFWSSESTAVFCCSSTLPTCDVMIQICSSSPAWMLQKPSTGILDSASAVRLSYPFSYSSLNECCSRRTLLRIILHDLCPVPYVISRETSALWSVCQVNFLPHKYTWRRSRAHTQANALRSDAEYFCSADDNSCKENATVSTKLLRYCSRSIGRGVCCSHYW